MTGQSVDGPACSTSALDSHRSYPDAFAIGVLSVLSGTPPDRDNRQYYLSDEDFAKRSNLVFVEKQGYNYDRERMQREGNDWHKALL